MPPRELLRRLVSLAVVRTIFGTAQQTHGVGSGFILDTGGRIVTNNHVVQDTDQLAVTFQDRATTQARLLGRDPDNDLAVVQVDPAAVDDGGQAVADRLRPVVLGDSDDIRIGEQAIAIGSPMGLQQSVTAGIVSARRSPGDESTDQLQLLGGAVQTDAAINPGNSGGPLFNAEGQVLALPTSQRGLLVQDVTGGASQAGIRGGSRAVAIGGVQIRLGGDIIIALDGQPVATGGELRGFIENNKRPGDTVNVSVLRNGQRLELTVTLTERSPQ